MKKNFKISRGYRLKPATHSLIKNLQDLTETDTDAVISKSCKLFLKRIIENDNLKDINFDKIKGDRT